jgi:hypothetical protein
MATWWVGRPLGRSAERAVTPAVATVSFSPLRSMGWSSTMRILINCLPVKLWDGSQEF